MQMQQIRYFLTLAQTLNFTCAAEECNVAQPALTRAIQALEEHKLAGKVLVSGQDADLAAIIRILSGTQTMTVYKPLGSQAKLAAEAAVALAKGEAVKTTAAVSIGDKTIPAIPLNPVVVTKDNVKETVIKDGFQNLETIQKSLPKEKWPR